MGFRALALTGALVLVASGVANPAVANVQPDPEWIRVMMADGDPALELQVRGPVRFMDAQSRVIIQEFDHLKPVSLRADAQGIFVGNDRLAARRLLVVARDEGSIYVNGIRLRGSLEIIPKPDLSLLVVNHIPIESYLRGVLSKEAPDYWPEEALKAIAIAARTYALHRRFTKAASDYDVTSNVMSQEYGGKDSEKHGTDQAVMATRGQIILYDQQLFPPFYHSTCGAVTENGAIMGSAYNIAPLRGGVQCFGEASPFHTWKRRFTPEDVNWVLHKGPFGKVGAVQQIRVDKRTAFGRIEEITIVGSTRELKLKGYDFRALFGFDKIRSLEFTVSKSGRDFIINGHGWGHGVGMCQWGAAELARRGYTADQILAHYYPQTQLNQLETLRQRTVKVIGGS